MFPALDAKAAGFKVYAVMDASGDPSEMASRTTLARFVQAGVDPDVDQRGAVRDPPHLEPPGSSRARETLRSWWRRTMRRSSRATRRLKRSRSKLDRAR